jgi:hypothetical protein
LTGFLNKQVEIKKHLVNYDNSDLDEFLEALIARRVAERE